MKYLFFLIILSFYLNASAITEGYPNDHSVFQGGSITLHISTNAPSYYLQIFREGAQRELIHTIPADSFPAGQNYFQPGQGTNQSGCGWPAAYTLRIPDTWKSGPYIVKICAPGDSGTVRINQATVYYYANLFVNEIFFTVKNRNPGQDTKILFCVADNNYQAYNGWDGGGYYDGNQSSASFRRPYGDFSGYCQGFHDWDQKFVRWAEKNGYVMDYCSEVDLNNDRSAQWVQNYKVVIQNGHSEYLTGDEWHCLANFQENYGGRFLIFSGNTGGGGCRFSGDGSLLYRSGGSPPSITFGLSMQGNLQHWKKYNDYPKFYYNTGDTGTGEKCGFTVSLQGAGHWVFAGTGLKPGDVFGYESRSIGYEMDGRSYSYNGATHSMTTSGPTPGTVVLAGNRYRGLVSKYSTNTCMILFSRGSKGGFTFNEGNINWAYGLYLPQWERARWTNRMGSAVDTFDTDIYIQRITKNLLDSCGLGFLDRTPIKVEGKDKIQETEGFVVKVQPNPFSVSTKIAVSCQLSAVSNFSLKIFDINGKMVNDFTSKIKNQQSSILNQITWNPSRLPAGIYTMRVKTSDKTLSKRLVLLK
jgi:hypothetical protein